MGWKDQDKGWLEPRIRELTRLWKTTQRCYFFNFSHWNQGLNRCRLKLNYWTYASEHGCSILKQKGVLTKRAGLGDLIRKENDQETWKLGSKLGGTDPEVAHQFLKVLNSSHVWCQKFGAIPVIGLKCWYCLAIIGHRLYKVLQYPAGAWRTWLEQSFSPFGLAFWMNTLVYIGFDWFYGRMAAQYYCNIYIYTYPLVIWHIHGNRWPIEIDNFPS